MDSIGGCVIVEDVGIQKRIAKLALRIVVPQQLLKVG